MSASEGRVLFDPTAHACIDKRRMTTDKNTADRTPKLRLFNLRPPRRVIFNFIFYPDKAALAKEQQPQNLPWRMRRSRSAPPIIYINFILIYINYVFYHIKIALNNFSDKNPA
ncbi:MAG: hypothetical protein FWH25_01715 [Syntrophorhabdaceae bacterium]|nr:hypothetical protein [Syntrophorhabdaceae bacterium]